jgi:hypothetical protein
MVARLGLSPDPRLGQGLSSQPPGGLAPPVFGAEKPGSWSEERRRAEAVLDPLAEIIGVAPGGQADLQAPQEQVPAPAMREVVPSAVVTSPGQAVPGASSVRGGGDIEAGRWPTLSSVCEAGVRVVSPQAQLSLP